MVEGAPEGKGIHEKDPWRILQDVGGKATSAAGTKLPALSKERHPRAQGKPLAKSAGGAAQGFLCLTASL